MDYNRVIVALSGGKASAYCAKWAFDNFPKEKIVLYFNDTKWEHKDLYRFLGDLEIYFDHKITYDNDGRSPEELFYDNNALANNYMPFCSRELKAKRLQSFFEDKDVIIFGISKDEAHRAKRIVEIYANVSKKRTPVLIFPLIQDDVSREKIDEFLEKASIKQPELYSLGFAHNNCSGGCVRAGKKQWMMLYQKLPDVYADRERVEREMREWTGKDISFFKDETLETFRHRIDEGRLSAHYFDKEVEQEKECVGICNLEN